jgi:predicted AAA+ superfamily ATPase
MIIREIQNELAQCAREYPAVTIFGPRQSGKTTLAKSNFPHLPYFSFEDPDIRARAQQDPRGLLKEMSRGAILDEVQRAPDILSYLQGVIDKDPAPGKFILTGSHQPLVHQTVMQSLAGRTSILELLPFSLRELKAYPKENPSPYSRILNGFYPRLHEGSLNPERFFKAYLSTYVERDIRMLINLKDLSCFESFLTLLAGRTGQIVNYSSLASDVGVSSTTIKNWISILKACYILYELPPYFRNISKQVMKSPKLFFTDTGLACYLLNLTLAEQVERDPLRGNLYENLLIMDQVKQLMNQGKKPRLFYYRDSHGHEVDLLIPCGRQLIPVEIKSGATFHPEFIRGIRNFRKTAGPEICLSGQVWYNGETAHEFKGEQILNPLLHAPCTTE